MDEIRQLRAVFRVQLALRGLTSVAITGAFVFGLTVLTADLSAWWFDAYPLMLNLATWIRSSNPWDFFVIVFIVINAFHYFYVVQGVVVDRHNLRILVAQSQDELANDEHPKETIALRRAILGGRRRLLESVLRFDPTLWGLGTLALCLALLNHLTSALVVLAFSLFLVSSIPGMISRFTVRRLKTVGKKRDELPGIPLKDPRERAERTLAETSARLRVFVDRPIERLRVGWPALVAAAFTVATVAGLTISDMNQSKDLPERATLLILLLVIAGRSALSSAQNAEDLAFFASALTEIEDSGDGTETI